MKPSTELFDLIGSLTKSEKRFFKLSSSLQSGDKNYLKIFDAIEKQTEYDEERLKQLFAEETFIRHFPSEKNHLYKLILKSLRLYHSDKSSGSVLKQEIKNIEILFRKALFKECAKYLARAKKIAVKNEKFYYSIDLINWERMLLEESYESGDFSKKVNDLILEEQGVIEELTNLAQYQVLYSRINYLFKIGGFVKGDERKQVEQIAMHPLIKDSSLANSVRAKSICYYVRGFCCESFRDVEGMIKNFGEVVRILDENKDIKNDVPKRYIRALTNYIHGFVSMKRYEEAEVQLQKLIDLSKDSAFSHIDVEITLFTNRVMSQLLLLNRKGLFSEAVELVDNLAREMEEDRHQINKENDIIFSYLIAYIYFGNGQYKEALQWINRVLNDNENTLRQDIYSYARIFALLIHLEKESYDLLEYLNKSTYRHFRKNKDDYKVELRLLEFIKKLSKNQSRTQRLDIYKEMQDKFVDIFETEDDRIILQYIDFKSWVKSKIEGRPFSEVVQEKGGQLLSIKDENED
tara:strand:- start:1584 stop:3143 length:1560 start_codon:yes stop_codon:yes gene_type:complete